LNSGDGYSPTGGYFRADFPLSDYIEFAYKIWPTPQSREMFAHLPKWVITDRYSIDARAAGNPTKDQMRLMVQSLLADRFQLAAHFATQEVPVFALTVVKDGKLGPKLIAHADGVLAPVRRLRPTLLDPTLESQIGCSVKMELGPQFAGLIQGHCEHRNFARLKMNLQLEPVGE
jgi:uncharacterized protein (TIGR03435 family)